MSISTTALLLEPLERTITQMRNVKVTHIVWEEESDILSLGVSGEVKYEPGTGKKIVSIAEE